MSALSDLTKDLFDPANIRARCREIEAACSIEVDFNHEIERLVKAAHISKEEGEQIGGILMLSKPDDGLYGGPSLWKLTQSVSAFARDAEPVRKRELETLTGDMLRSRVLNIEDPVSTKLLNE